MEEEFEMGQQKVYKRRLVVSCTLSLFASVFTGLKRVIGLCNFWADWALFQ